VGSIPDEITGFFNLPNPSSRTMALGSTQPLTEMSTRNLPAGEGRPQGHSAAGRIKLIENSNDLIGNRTRDLPACE
jgi:hypothetical protein